MHVADPLSRCSDHYIHSSEDNKEQVLLQPETVNKIIDASEKSHDDRQLIISEFHDLPAAGHKGNKATYNALRKYYRWKGMKEQVQQYVKHCQRCQKGKATNKPPAGELLPLPTPQGLSDRQQDWVKWIKIAQFVWNNTVSSVTTDSPFGITRSYSPCLGTELFDVSAPVAKDFTAIFNKVIAASEKAKITMKSQADKHRSAAPIYKTGDQVWLSTDNLRMLNRASKKLTEKWIGPYEISSVMPNAVELKLPKTLRIHPVVNISRVKPYLGPLPGQPIPRPGPIHVSEDCDKEYEVDTIIDSCIYKGKFQYLVHWKGYDESERTWELVSNLRNSPEIVEQFHKSHPSAPWHLRMTHADFSSLFSTMPSNLCDPFPTFCHVESDT